MSNAGEQHAVTFSLVLYQAGDPADWDTEMTRVTCSCGEDFASYIEIQGESVSSVGNARSEWSHHSGINFTDDEWKSFTERVED